MMFQKLGYKQSFVFVLAALSLVLLPFYTIGIVVSGVRVSLPELFMIGTIVVWASRKDVVFFLRSFFRRFPFVFYGVSLFFVGFLLSLFFHPSLHGVGIFKSWLFIPLAFSFVLYDIASTTRRAWWSVVAIVFFGSALVALIALLFAAFGEFTYDGRLTAFFESPNQLSLFLFPSVFLGVALLKHVRTETKNVFFWGGTVLLSAILIVLLLTKTWTVWMAIAGGVVVSTLFFAPKKVLPIVGIVTLLALLLGGFFWQQPKFVDLRENFERSSLSSRIMIWQSSQIMLREDAIFGIGPGNFQDRYLGNQKYFPPYLEWAVPHPHNLYLATWLSTGVIGFIGFLTLVLWWSGALWRNAWKKKNVSLTWMTLAVWGAMSATLFYGLVDTPFWKNDLSVQFWTLYMLGLVLLGTKSVPNESGEVPIEIHQEEYEPAPGVLSSTSERSK